MNYTVSKKAELDLAGIARWTADRWDDDQAVVYTDGLISAFERLGKRPSLGRACSDLGRGLYRYAHVSHVIYFRVRADSVFIVRVLHKAQLSKLHL